MNCKNCGAPIGKDSICEYCNSYYEKIETGNIYYVKDRIVVTGGYGNKVLFSYDAHKTEHKII